MKRRRDYDINVDGSTDGGGGPRSVLPCVDEGAFSQEALDRLQRGGEPATAEEYMYAVRMQARAAPGLLLMSGAASTSASGGSTVLRVAAAGPSHDLSAIRHLLQNGGHVGWQDRVLSDFAGLRALINELQDRMDGKRPAAAAAVRAAAVVPSPPALPPPVSDLAAWRACCLESGPAQHGSASLASLEQAEARHASRRRLTRIELSDGSDGEEGDYGDDGFNGSAASSNAASNNNIGVDFKPLPPWLSVLMQYDQLAVLRSLKRLIPYFLRRFAAATEAQGDPSSSSATSSNNDSGSSSARGVITTAEAAWLYALLARLEKPLLADVASLIRQLFVGLRSQRNALLSKAVLVPSQQQQSDGAQQQLVSEPQLEGVLADALASLHVLLAIAGRFFEQRLPGED